MIKDNLHSQLNRQINKFLSEEIINDNPSLQKFIEVVNQSYNNYDKDSDLIEQSMRLNDLEFYEINKKINDQLEKHKNIRIKLIEAIKELNIANEIEVENENNLIDLLHVLNNEIKIKKEFEEQLHIAKHLAENANEAKTDFLSIMSHEIRTPLNAIIGLIYIIEKENSIESFHENIDVLRNSAKNLFLLINNILDFNKIESGNIELEKIPFNLKDLIIEIVSSFKSKALENKNTLEVIFDDNFVPNIISDPLRLSQILTNLIINAIKFTKNGLIQVKVNQIANENKISSFKIQIIDNGIGIDLEMFKSIFQKFTQANTKTSREYGGSGLGLVISKKLLLLLDSEIELKSEIGKGSNFSFVLKLPIFDNNSNNESASDAYDYNEKNLDGLKVLLVEDNLINVTVARKILMGWNVDVEVALNGLIAVEKQKLNSYDVILMDLSMPVMDGYEATAIIRLTNSTIPIIALTASSSYLSLEKALQIGVDECITKPFSPKELNLKLSKYYNY